MGQWPPATQKVWEGPFGDGVLPCLDPWDSVRLRAASEYWNVPGKSQIAIQSLSLRKRSRRARSFGCEEYEHNITPGLASQRDCVLTATKVVLSNQRGLRQYVNGRGPKDPTVRREGTREPRIRGAISCCGLSRQPQARSGQTVGEVRPTSLPSSSTVFTVGAGLHWTTSKTTQMQFLDKLMTSIVVQRPVPGRDSPDNCGGSVVA